ncbi:MAG: alpha-N-arabinofuranosidase [Saprospiraceae bacterium]|nr:alpha-N-arabinofuranosidase [Saprospiraceae bacterium]MBK8776854.1 alpha-N-arabinofuranosidase [Saprospiraceae bacterium]
MSNKKIISIILFSACLALEAIGQAPVKVVIDGSMPSHQINRHIYGHFSEHLGRCIYDGFWVSDTMKVAKQGRIRLDIVEALKKIKIPNLRWPGGCFADEYHWRDGIGPRAARPTMVNTHWGNVVEDNSFGTNEFLELCELLGTEAYIAGNAGSGTVLEMSNWVEYLNHPGGSTLSDLRKLNGHPAPYKVKFWGVGNETWGCGGNMTAEYYANEYKRYATYVRNYPGVPINRIASGANGADYNWTETLMKNVGPNRMWGTTLHHYSIPSNTWAKKGSATNFTEGEYATVMKNAWFMDELVTRHSTIMDKYDMDKKVALVVDEWGVWTDVEPGTNPGFLYQQNSLRDALVAGMTLNIFNNHSDRVRIANLAQTINVLQALILTKGRDFLLTPTYHIFDMYKVHMDAQYLPVRFTSPDYMFEGIKVPAVNISASKDSMNVVHISLVNIDPTKSISLSLSLADIYFNSLSGTVVTAANYTDHNDFDDKNKISIKPFNGAKKSGSNLLITLPSKSIVMLELK